jgi:hypothetical protein
VPVGIVWVDRERAFVVGDRLAEASLLLKPIGEVEADGGIAGPDRQRLAVVCDRLVMAVEALEQVGKIAVGVGIIGRQCERVSQLHTRLLRAPQREQQETEVAVRFCRIRLTRPSVGRGNDALETGQNGGVCGAARRRSGGLLVVRDRVAETVE